MRNLVRILFALFIVGNAYGAGEEVAATAAAHQDDEPIATPAAETAPRTKVVGEDVSYGSIDGTELRGYLARPADADANTPGLIVIHEWWGLNDNIRQATQRLAGEGFVALAVDLYDGESAAVPKDAIKLMTALNENAGRGEANLRQAYAYLDGTIGAPRIGSIGWCLGGKWSLRTAILLPDQLDATVIYYGSLVTDAEELAPLKMPVLGNFAEQDRMIPPDAVNAFKQAMTELGKDIDVKIYPGANHAFANPSGQAYNAAAAEDAWERTTTFLNSNLRSD